MVAKTGTVRKMIPAPLFTTPTIPIRPTQRRGEATEDDQHRSCGRTSRNQRFEIATHGRSPVRNRSTLLFITTWIGEFREGDCVNSFWPRHDGYFWPHSSDVTLS